MRSRPSVCARRPRSRVGVVGMAFPVPLVLFLTSGCEPPPPAGELGGAIRTLEPELVIGSYEEENYTLNAVIDLAVDGLGRIYVLQGSPPEVAVYEPGGTYVRSVGRAGQGPGEFFGPTKLGWLGDSLWVSQTNLRVSLFDTAGVFLYSFQPGSLPRNSDGTRILAVFPLSTGLTLGMVWPSGGQGWPATGTFPASASPVLRLSRSGAIVDTMAMLPESQFLSWAVTARNGGNAGGTHPISDRPFFVVSPRGEAVVILDRSAEAAAAGRFRVLKLTAAGDTLLDRIYQVAPKSLDRERIIDHLYGLHPETAEIIARGAFEKDLGLPSHFPPVTSTVVGYDGTIWLRREDLPWEDSVGWSVLGPEGDPLFTVYASRRVFVEAATATTVWAVRRDLLDVPFVVRYRVK